MSVLAVLWLAASNACAATFSHERYHSSDGGVYGSLRGGDTAIPSQQDQQDQSQPEPDRPTTVADARESFPTLLETYVTQLGDPEGAVRIKDSSGRWLTGRVVRAETTTVRSSASSGMFWGDVTMAGAGGKRFKARAELDLRGSEWRVSKLEIPPPVKALAAPAPGKAPDAGRPFGAAVLKEVQAGSKTDGSYAVVEESSGRTRHLKLRSIPTDDLAPLGDGRYRGLVYMTDLADGSAVAVDFFVDLSGQAGQVYKTAVRQGTPRAAQ